jgi:hypothetical protein
MMGAGGIGAGLGSAVAGGGVPARAGMAGGAAAAAAAAAESGISAPIPVAHIPQALYGMALDEESQQRAKGLFARLDAVRPIARGLFFPSIARLLPHPAAPAASARRGQLTGCCWLLAVRHVRVPQDGNGVLTRDDFEFETTGDVSGRKAALWTTLIRKTFDEDGGGDVTIHEMIVKLGDLAMERPGDFTMHNSQAPMATLVIQMNAAFNAVFKQVLTELEQAIGAAVA